MINPNCSDCSVEKNERCAKHSKEICPVDGAICDRKCGYYVHGTITRRKDLKKVKIKGLEGYDVYIGKEPTMLGGIEKSLRPIFVAKALLPNIKENEAERKRVFDVLLRLQDKMAEMTGSKNIIVSIHDIGK